jgi:hypothetical protein
MANSWLDNMWGDTALGGPDIGNGNYGRGSPKQVAQQVATAQRAREDDTDRLRRAQYESDREYELEVKKLKQARENIAIRKGEAAANKWYQEQSIQLAKQKFAEDQRQFDMTFAEGQRQFNDTSLQGWTDKALTLSRTPKDWVTLERMQKGVASNAGNIPGLAWAAGGQLGNTTFAGNPESNSLANVLGNMGMNVGQGAAQQTAAPSGNWASQAAQQAHQMVTQPLNLRPDQQQLYQTAREFAMNPHQSAPGWYENLDPLTRDLLQGAAEDQGLDWSSAMSRLKRSRWSGGSSSMAA